MTYTEHALMARWFHMGGNTAPTRVVIHTAEIDPRAGSARAVANYLHTTDRKASAHAVVDNSEAWRCVQDFNIAYHAPPNAESLGVELCTRAAATPAWWANGYHDALLHNAAAIVADWCRRYGVPVRLLTVAQLRNGERGICGHVHVSAAWGQTNHTDPGPSFPWARFLQLVAGTEPAPSPPMEDDMALILSADNTQLELGVGLNHGVPPQRLDEEDAAGLAVAGVKTAHVSRALFDRINSRAEG